MSWRILLDSNVFRNRGFLDWLRLRSKDFEVLVSPIVYAETALWYTYVGLGVKGLDKDLEGVGGEIIEIGKKEGKLVAEMAYKYRKETPFRHHARDYLIGVQAITSNSSVVTQNRDHFSWLEKEGIKVFSPEELVKEWLDSS